MVRDGVVSRGRRELRAFRARSFAQHSLSFLALRLSADSLSLSLFHLRSGGGGGGNLFVSFIIATNSAHWLRACTLVRVRDFSHRRLAPALSVGGQVIVSGSVVERELAIATLTGPRGHNARPRRLLLGARRERVINVLQAWRGHLILFPTN